MGTLRPPIPAKLFIGMIARDPERFEECSRHLSAEYGPVDMRSGVLQWKHSDYYGEEMGPDLQRMFLFFDRLIDPGDLSLIKLHTIKLEALFSLPGPSGPRRSVNIDPGYLTEAKIVLATTKDFPHRIYLGNGIYAEVELHYSRTGRDFVPVEHTYPDFRTETSRELFKEARERLRSVLRRRGRS